LLQTNGNGRFQHDKNAQESVFFVAFVPKNPFQRVIF
jgi:hypothetical protein